MVEQFPGGALNPRISCGWASRRWRLAGRRSATRVKADHMGWVSRAVEAVPRVRSGPAAAGVLRGRVGSGPALRLHGAAAWHRAAVELPAGFSIDPPTLAKLDLRVYRQPGPSAPHRLSSGRARRLGKPAGYVGRQVEGSAQRYAACCTEDVPAMECTPWSGFRGRCRPRRRRARAQRRQVRQSDARSERPDADRGGALLGDVHARRSI